MSSLDLDALQVDVVGVRAFRSQSELGHAQIVHVDAQADGIACRREVIVARQADRAGGNLESERVARVIPQRACKYMVELEVAP